MNTSLPKTEFERLVLEARPLARRIARKVARVRSSLSVEDLFQEAMIGIMRAAKTFDPSRGVSFFTYARYSAFAAARRAQLDRGSMIRTPVWRGVIGRVHVLSTDAALPSTDGSERTFGDLWLVDETTPELLFGAREFIHKVRDLLRAECTPRQTKVFEETVLGEATMVDQAAELGTCHSTIKGARDIALQRAKHVVKCLWREPAFELKRA